MPKKGRLTATEKQRIIAGLAEGLPIMNLATELERDPRTLATFVRNPNIKPRKDKGTRRNLTDRDLRKIRREIARNPSSTSATIFARAGVIPRSRQARCNVLNEMARNINPIPRPPLNQIHKEKRLAWAQKYMKMNFQNVLFTDEARATLDGPDGWAKVWNPIGTPTPHRFRRQQGGGSIMFWAGIIGDKLCGPFRVPEGVKLTSNAYTAFLNENLLPWLDDLPLSRRFNIIFMHDNAPSHAARATTSFLGSQGFVGETLMSWPPCSPDLNPIEHLWSILKRGVYEGGKQFSSKDALWSKIVDVARSITPSQIKKLTSSVDKRLFNVISRHGGYVDK